MALTYSFPDLEPVCSMSSSNCCFLTCIQVSQEVVRWYGIPISLRIFHFVVIHKAKVFNLAHEKEVDVFWNSLAFSMPQQDGSVQFSCSVVSDSLQPHDPQYTRPPCPSPTPRVHPNPCPLSQWCHPAISSSVVPFSSCPQSPPASGSFQMSQLLTSGGQNIGVSASTSVLPMNTQDWSPLGWTGWTSLQSKGLSRVFSNTTVQKHQFFGAQLSL